jgi:chromosome segregation protein
LPGKKLTRLSLLSGGEKALSAIAFIFSIFLIKPASFCLLDEIDAPLDDANVGRYARMVKEMSEKVQFIYITHNKISMELADQLMGVTMHEPGVSRLVSVDVEEAAELAAS